MGMTGMMKGVLIDPQTKSLDYVSVTMAGNGMATFHDLYRIMGCSMVEFVYADRYPSGYPRLVVIVDEEGLLKDGAHYFHRFLTDEGDVSVPLCGKAVVLGLSDQTLNPDGDDDEGGDLIGCPLTLDEVKQRVLFPETAEVRQFRDAGGFDTRISAAGANMQPVGPVEQIPVRPELPGDAPATDEGGPYKYGVICQTHGLRELSEQQYQRQLVRINEVWRCPQCGRAAEWDDDSQCMNEENES
jgi:hypothetical protein